MLIILKFDCYTTDIRRLQLNTSYAILALVKVKYIPFQQILEIPGSLLLAGSLLLKDSVHRLLSRSRSRVGRVLVLVEGIVSSFLQRRSDYPPCGPVGGKVDDSPEHWLASIELLEVFEIPWPRLLAGLLLLQDPVHRLLSWSRSRVVLVLVLVEGVMSSLFQRLSDYPPCRRVSGNVNNSSEHWLASIEFLEVFEIPWPRLLARLLLL